MGRAIEITCLDRSAAELRALAVKAEDSDVVRRLLGIALLLDGWSRGEAATASGMDRQTLCDAQMAELKALVIQGPDPEKDGVVRWRCVDLRTKIAGQFSVTFHKRSVARLLRKLDLTRLQPRPYHPEKDAAAQEAFKKRARVAGPPVAFETGRAILSARGAAEKFLVDLTP
jgi:hypothetical protein